MFGDIIKSKRAVIIKIDADDSKKKASNRGRDFMYSTRYYRRLCPDSTDNPISITRRRLLYAEL